MRPEHWWYTIPLRLRSLFRRARVEQDLDEELRFHLERQAAENIARGLSPGDARRAAIRGLDDIEVRKEECRDARRLNLIHHFAQDLRYAVRGLRKNPGFTLLAVLVMALGIGVNTAVFTVVNAILLRPLAYHDPDRIVTLTSVWPRTGAHVPLVTLPDYIDWRDGGTSFSEMAYYRKSQRPVALGSSAHYARVARVSTGFFRVFGASAGLGRVFSANDESHTAIVSYAYWQNLLGGIPGILNQTLRIDGQSCAIVGVMPAGFMFPDKTEIWQLSDMVNREMSAPRSSLSYLVVARLKPAVSVDQTQGQMAGISARLEQQYPRSNRGRSVAVARLRDDLTGDVRLTLVILTGAVALVLLIACSNIATLLLAKATARRQEIAIRVAIGAGRARIVRQLLTESLLLAGLAGAFGSITALYGSRALVALAPEDVPRLSEVGVDGRVLAFTLAISGLASLLFGVVPAWFASKVDLNETLKQGGSRAVVSGRAGRMRRALVICEIALSMVLLTGAGLLIRSFVALNNVELGFRPEHVLVMETSVPGSGAQAARFFRELIADITGTPGVLAAGATMGIPGHVESAGSYWVDHLPKDSAISPFDAVFSVVTPGTFSALQAPLKRGRDFSSGDLAGAPLTAVINEALARKSFGSQDPIGRTLFAGFDSQKPMTIVGVVGNLRQWNQSTAPAPEIFMPYEQHTDGAGTALRVVARSSAAPEALEETLRRMVRERSPDVPVKFTTMEKSLYEGVAAPRFRTLLMVGFACIALGLAMAGVYGVMAYTVGQRTSEIGLRMALGADTAAVLWMVLRQGLALTAAGMALGLLGSMAATRLLTGIVFQVRPDDPATYAVVALSLGVITLAACYLPASRAAKVDPLAALRT